MLHLYFLKNTSKLTAVTQNSTAAASLEKCTGNRNTLIKVLQEYTSELDCTNATFFNL